MPKILSSRYSYCEYFLESSYFNIFHLHFFLIMNRFILIKKIIPQIIKRTIKRGFFSFYDGARYYRLRKKAVNISGRIKHVVFICKGNICRSAFAEKYLKSVVNDHTIVIDSCGLYVDRAHRSPAFVVQAGKQYGLNLKEHRSKSLNKCNFQKANLVILMEYEQLLSFRSSFPKYSGKAKLIRDFLPWPERFFCNLYDPYGLEMKEFQNCFRTIKRALDRMHSMYIE